MMCTKFTGEVLLLRRKSVLAILAIQQTGQTTQVTIEKMELGECQCQSCQTDVGGESLVAHLLALWLPFCKLHYRSCS